MDSNAELSLYRCYTGSDYIDIIAANESVAVEKSGGMTCAKLCEWPIPSFADIRSQWKSLSQTKDGLEKIRKWMVAAVRMKIIDAKKFNEMDQAVQNALDAISLQGTSGQNRVTIQI